MKINGKVFIVTGGGAGLGRELTLQLLTKGASVAIVDINEAAMQETVKLAGTNCDRLSTHHVTITNHEAVDHLPKEIKIKHGHIDGLINNAGIIQPFIKFKDLDYEVIDRVIHINLYGTLYMTSAFLPHLLERSEAYIVNVSSMGGFVPVPGQTIYGLSKAGVILFTEGLSAELMDTHVHVTLVLPGGMDTEIAKNSGVEETLKMPDDQVEPKMLPIDKAAAIVIDAIEKNSYRVLVGSDAKTMDLLNRISPKMASKMIYRKMKHLLA